MNEQIKFDSRYYVEVRNYLDGHKDLHGVTSFGGEGRIYRTSRRHNGDIKGVILQMCSRNDECMVSMINEHPSFNQIKEDLEKIVKK